jgi:hypothetical protein
MTGDLIRERFGTIFKRGLVEYTMPKPRKRKRRFKLHKGHSTRPDWDELDADKNMAIKFDSKKKGSEFKFIKGDDESDTEI